MASHLLRSELVAAALEMTISEEGTLRRGSSTTIAIGERKIHGSLSFGKRRLDEAGIVPSMGRVGSALDNAIFRELCLHSS
jgi:transposase InsO family protein